MAQQNREGIKNKTETIKMIMNFSAMANVCCTEIKLNKKNHATIKIR